MAFVKDCKILELTELIPGTFSMLLDGGELARACMAGQFVNVTCGDDLLLRRPISVCDAEGDTLRLVFEVRGEGTARLAKLSAGDSVNVLGPLGKGFTAPAGKLLVVGGGIGVPPMLKAAKSAERAVAALGVRSADRIILKEDFEAVCEKTEFISDDGSTGRKGFVANLVRDMLTEDPEIAGVLACGPKIMLKTVYAEAKKAGIPCWVSMEERMGCGIGACLVCACKLHSEDGDHYKHVCKDGPVFNGEEVCWDE